MWGSDLLTREAVGDATHRFWGWRGVGMMADGGHHGEGEHDERDVAMPAMPGTGFTRSNVAWTRSGFSCPSVTFVDHSPLRSLIGVPLGLASTLVIFLTVYWGLHAAFFRADRWLWRI